MIRLSFQRGASLVTAIFLLVVLSGLAVAMVTLATTQQTSSALDVQGARAYLAARAGTEWGVFQVTRAKGPCFQSGLRTVIDSFDLPTDGSLAGFSVTVVCKRTLDTVSGLERYTVKSTACNRPSSVGCLPSNATDKAIDYVQRVVHVEFSVPGEP